MLCQSLDKACTFENITAGFTKTGIFPLNSDIFTAADFLPSTVFVPKHSVAANPNHIESAVSSQAHKSSEPVAAPSSDPEQSLILSVQYETMSEEEEAPPLHDSSFKLLTDIRPLPNYDRDQVETTTTVQKRNCGYSKVLTSSPEKDKLLMIMNVKKRKMGTSLTEKLSIPKSPKQINREKGKLEYLLMMLKMITTAQIVPIQMMVLFLIGQMSQSTQNLKQSYMMTGKWN